MVGMRVACQPREWGSPVDRQTLATIRGWTANTQNNQRMDPAGSFVFPERCHGKGKQGVGMGRDGGTCGAIPQQWEHPKAIAASLTGPGHQPSYHPHPTHTSLPLPWDIRAGASRCPIPIRGRDTTLLPRH